ncbi:MAG TPA: energy transducer TonB [Terriglobales bacterium]|jgi:TonB family protein|nr:energy transducer TonB [Terriglobales bacterium]
MNLGPGRESFSLEKRPPELNAAPLAAGPEQKQRRLMLVALALLLVALIVVLIKDRQFWFPSSQAAESDVADEGTDTTGDSQPQTSATQIPGSARPKAKRASSPVAATPPPATAAPAVTASRAVLPPLEVEVVAGGQRQTIPPTNNSIKVDLQPKPSGSAANPGSAVTSATERVQLSPDTVQVVSHPVQPNYPLLAKQMKVQGAVVLQALIGKEGAIQDLQVISGPAILSSAAREAVMQWRFKPYYQAGQPVETEARITVNFTISTY